MDRIEEARAKARLGDLLALRALERQREAAFSRGDIRTRRPLSPRHMELQRAAERARDEAEPLGDPIATPGPGWGDVGSGPRPSHRDPHPISMLLERYVRDKGWTQRLEVASVTVRWPEIVGQTVAKHCVVEDFDDEGTLTLRASSTSWESQIRALLATLEATLARELGEGVVKKIMVKGPARPSWKHGLYSVPGRGPRDTYD